MLIHDRADFDHRFDQPVRRQNVSESQRWVHDLAERAGIDDAAAIIESLQAGQRRAGKAKLRVVIVLENVGVVFVRKLDQQSSPRQTHGHTERKLMRWSDINYLGREFL